MLRLGKFDLHSVFHVGGKHEVGTLMLKILDKYMLI